MTAYKIPTRQDILADFRKCNRRALNDPQSVEFQAVRAVRRWIKCGYNINELPLLISGLTPAIIAKGISEAA